jgi:hypothetical protein
VKKNQNVKWVGVLVLAVLAASTGSRADASHPSPEVVPADESAAIERVARSIEESVREEAKSGPAHRDAHAKAHGCVRASFRVLPGLPQKLRVGIFQNEKTIPAWIRFSNGSGKSQDDSSGDGRGMTIKLMGIAKSESTTQDFLMINHPVFFVRNAADYVEFTDAVSSGHPLKFFFPSLNPLDFRLHEMGIGLKIQFTKVKNPLLSRYWSMTPYLFGETEMKYSARPCARAHSDFVATKSPNFLRDNLSAHLNQSEACFEFQVQLRTQPASMPIEDATVKWSEKVSPFLTVARITIPRQAFTSVEQMQFCENLSYTPWHAIPEFRPLGGINRARKKVYETVSRVRHELNGTQRSEPTGF